MPDKTCASHAQSLETLLYKAAVRGDYLQVRDCLQKGVSLDKIEDEIGMNALAGALENHQIKTVLVLLKAGADTRCVNHKGENALEAAWRNKAPDSLMRRIYRVFRKQSCDLSQENMDRLGRMACALQETLIRQASGHIQKIRLKQQGAKERIP